MSFLASTHLIKIRNSYKTDSVGKLAPQLVNSQTYELPLANYCSTPPRKEAMQRYWGAWGGDCTKGAIKLANSWQK